MTLDTLLPVRDTVTAPSSHKAYETGAIKALQPTFGTIDGAPETHTPYLGPAEDT